MKNNLKEGEIDLDTFTYIIFPILKLNPQAKYYTKNENLCKYFEFDTIHFDCEVGIFLNQTIYFYCCLGTQACNDEPFYLFVRHYRYFNKKEEDFEIRFWNNKYQYKFLSDSCFKFYIKGFDFWLFKIKNKKNSYGRVRFK